MCDKVNKNTIENQLKIAEESLQKSKLTILRTANKCLEEAKCLPPLQKNFGTFWFTGELVILAGDTGVGKTLIAVEIIDGITSDKKVKINQKIDVTYPILYYDFELTERQFYERYKNFKFNNTFFRVVRNEKYEGKSLFSVDVIIEDLDKTGAKGVIIDNITELESKTTQDAETAKKIINDLKKLRNRGISILVLAHTPKIQRGIPIDINHLAGSKYLANLVDSVFFIARSSEEIKYRYIKNLKPRSTEDSDKVVIIEINKRENFLGFDFVKMDYEINHLQTPYSLEKEKLKAQIVSLRNEKKSYREIEDELGVPKSTVERLYKQATDK